MFTLLFIPLFLAFILCVWLDTDAFYEYATLIGVSKRGKVLGNFHKAREAGSTQLFKEYLEAFYYKNFFARLITCPVCLSTWLGTIAGIIVTIIWTAIFGPEGFFYAFIITLTYPYLTLISYKLIKSLH
jgi:hypothetical protein